MSGAHPSSNQVLEAILGVPLDVFVDHTPRLLHLLDAYGADLAGWAREDRDLMRAFGHLALIADAAQAAEALDEELSRIAGQAIPTPPGLADRILELWRPDASS